MALFNPQKPGRKPIVDDGALQKIVDIIDEKYEKQNVLPVDELQRTVKTVVGRNLGELTDSTRWRIYTRLLAKVDVTHTVRKTTESRDRAFHSIRERLAFLAMAKALLYFPSTDAWVPNHLVFNTDATTIVVFPLQVHSWGGV